MMKRTKKKPTYKLVEVYKVKDAIGAYCLDCQQTFSDLVPWDWTKSKWLHEDGTASRGKKHKVILVGIE